MLQRQTSNIYRRFTSGSTTPTQPYPDVFVYKVMIQYPYNVLEHIQNALSQNGFSSVLRSNPETNLCANSTIAASPKAHGIQCTVIITSPCQKFMSTKDCFGEKVTGVQLALKSRLRSCLYNSNQTPSVT